MNYKVGDTVRVRGDLELGEGNDSAKVIQDMLKFKGLITTISKIYPSGNYELVNNNWVWTDEMLEPITDYLTTEEFIEGVEGLGYRVARESIHYEGQNDLVIWEDLDSRKSISPCHVSEKSQTNLRFHTDDEKLKDIAIRYYLTPLDKRVAEKRFYLKFPNQCTACEYFNLSPSKGKWFTAGKSEEEGIKTIFTEADIPELQEKFPEINFDKLERVEVE